MPKSPLLPRLLQAGKNRIWYCRESRVFRYPLDHTPLPLPTIFRRNCLGRPMPIGRWQSSEGRGRSPITYVEGGRLLRYCWLIERQTRGEDGGWSTYAFLLPTRPSYLITLRILSREAADCTFKPYAGSYTTHGEVAGARQAYVTFGSNGPLRHVIEKVGFQQ